MSRNWTDAYTGLKFDRPTTDILEIIFDTPHTVNSVTEQMHTELVQVWRDVDGDPGIKVVLVRGANGKFSSGGDFNMVEAIMQDNATRVRILKEALDLVYNLLKCSKLWCQLWRGPPWEPDLQSPCCRTSRSPGARPGSWMATSGSGSPPVIMPPSCGPSLWAWPKPSTICCSTRPCPARRPTGWA